MLFDQRLKNERPEWIPENQWRTLIAEWGKEEYKEKCEKAKKNRASEKGGCVNTGGSISSYEHMRRLVINLIIDLIFINIYSYFIFY